MQRTPRCRLPYAFLDWWTIFDFFLVVGSITISWVYEPILKASTPSAHVVSPSFARIVRVLRVLRAARLVAQLDGVYLLVRGLYSNSFTMLSVAGLSALTCYMFGLAGLLFITQPTVRLRRQTDSFSHYKE